jgi:hypothetical protein
MKIDELQGVSAVKKVASAIQGVDLVDVSKQLKELGWKRIGSGAFARVYEHPNYPLVLKIFSSKDSCYIKFLKYVEQHSTNPFLPKVRGKLLKLNNDYYAVRLEKLQPLDISEWEDVYDEMIYELINESGYDFDLAIRKYPKHRNFLNTLRDISDSLNCRLDIHRYNFMKRGKQTVIIDPVWDGNL